MIKAPPLPKLPPKISTQQFFAALFPEFNGQHHLEIRKLPGGHQTFCRSIDAAVRASQDDTRNIYFGTTLRDGKYGDEEHASLMPALWADVDAKDFDDGKDAADKAVAFFEHKPSIVIDSGGGFHCYWLLREPEEIDDKNLSYLRGIELGIAEAIGGDRKCRDLSRIMRVPGTLRAKNAKGETVLVADCENPLPTRVISWRPERRYNLTDFEHYHVVEPVHKNTVPLPAGDYDPSRVSWKTKDFLAIGAEDGERNQRLFASSCDLKGCGCSFEAAESMLLDGAGRCQPPMGEDEARKTIKSAWADERGPSRPEPKEKVSEKDKESVGTDGFDTWPYRVENGCMGYLKTVGRGEDTTEIFVPLCNFSAQVIEEVAKDDGVEVRRVFLIDGALSGGRKLPQAEVAATQFSGMKWVVGNWGIKARMAAGQGACDRIREGIQMFSSDVRERTVYVHSGWRLTEHGWIFLHQGGAVGAADIETELEGSLSRYHLPASSGDVVTSVEASLALLEVADCSITYPLLLSVFLAPLSEMLNPDFSLWLYGVSGSMKSTLAALFLSHYGKFDWKSLPGSWESTGNALEKQLFQGKDVLFAIDDFSPQPTPAAQNRLMQAIARVVRAQGNLTGRARMRSDTTMQTSYPPRGLALMTGEDLPSGQSLMARLLTVEVEKSSIDIDKLTLAQDNTHHLTHTMTEYLKWLAPQIDDLKTSLPDQCRERRGEVLKNISHLRTPDIVANLLTAWDMFLQFSVSVGAVSDEMLHRLFDEAWTVLVEVAKKHSEKVRQVDPAERFLELVSSLFASQAVYVEIKEIQRRPDEMPPAGDMIGWADDEFYYFIPEAVRKAVGSALRASGDHWPHSQNALYQSLKKRNVLVLSPDGRSTSHVRVYGKKRRVMKIPRVALDLEGEDDS